MYQAVVENSAAEQAARMIAMKNATDNAGDLISNGSKLEGASSNANTPALPLIRSHDDHAGLSDRVDGGHRHGSGGAQRGQRAGTQ